MDFGLVGVLISLVILIYSAILHEIAHGWVADRLGDPTARLMGRLTLNPKPHIDPIMSIALPLILLVSGSPIIFGGAKPVPVDEFNLREGRKDTALVSLAGPMTNVLLAILGAIAIRLLLLVGIPAIIGNQILSFIYYILQTIVQLNILLAIFNLLPIPPLDGSKVFSLLLPEKDARAYLSLGQFGIVILLILLNWPLGSFSLEHLIFNLFQLFQKILLP